MPTTRTSKIMGRSTRLAICLILVIALVGAVALVSLTAFYALVIGAIAVLSLILVRLRRHGQGHDKAYY